MSLRSRLRLALHHFYCILLVKANHRISLDSRRREKDSGNGRGSYEVREERSVVFVFIFYNLTHHLFPSGSHLMSCCWIFSLSSWMGRLSFQIFSSLCSSLPTPNSSYLKKITNSPNFVMQNIYFSLLTFFFLSNHVHTQNGPKCID